MKHVLAAAFALFAATASAQGDTVDFELDQNIVWVKATINGQGPFDFIFDTGASITVVKPATAKKLGLKLESPVGGDGLLGGLLDMVGMNPKTAKLDSIALGGAKVADFEAVVMNVPQADIPLALMGKSYDGLIGYHFISRFVTTIDYKKKTIKLEPNDYDPGPTFPQLEEAAPAEKPAAFLGFSYRTVGDDEANEVGVEGGVVVGALAKDGPARKAGLQKGDVIQELDGRRIRTADEWRRATAKLKPGQEIKVLLLRSSEEKTVTFKVGKR